MPLIESRFCPPLWLRNGHAQTILQAILPRRYPSEPLKRDRTDPPDPTDRSDNILETLELDDGDFLSLTWQRNGNERLVILSHGLEGCAGQNYIRGMASTLLHANWDCLAWDFRGCSAIPNRLAHLYHSGATYDLKSVIERAAVDYRQIALVGFSLGGNLTLKYLGEAPPHPAVIGGAAISAPVDLASSARALDERPANRIYLRRFIKSLVAKIESKALRFPERIDITGIRAVRTFQQFDDRYTARLHGFRDADDYWTQSSARQYLRQIALPTLLINARNDPLLTPDSFPFPEAEDNPHFWFEAPESGGHVGFLDFKAGRQPWTERRVLEFFSKHFSIRKGVLP